MRSLLLKLKKSGRFAINAKNAKHRGLAFFDLNLPNGKTSIKTTKPCALFSRNLPHTRYKNGQVRQRRRAPRTRPYFSVVIKDILDLISKIHKS